MLAPSDPPPSGPDGPPPERQQVFLAVGVADRELSPEGVEPHAVIIHAPWRSLSAALLSRVLPDAVLTPLSAPEFDAIDMAEYLHDTGYRGRLLVVAPELPDRAMVHREIAGACPGIAVEFLTSG